LLLRVFTQQEAGPSNRKVTSCEGCRLVVASTQCIGSQKWRRTFGLHVALLNVIGAATRKHHLAGIGETSSGTQDLLLRLFHFREA